VQEKIEEAQREFNLILDYIVEEPMRLETRKTGDWINRRLLRTTPQNSGSNSGLICVGIRAYIQSTM
jgi:hypothetical protein